MGPTSGKWTRQVDAPVDVTDCESWAICSDGASLGWTAIRPCASCVAAVITKRSGPARDIGNLGVVRAQLVTADEFERLLLLVRIGRRATSTS
jgi:hypothetical protein